MMAPQTLFDAPRDGPKELKAIGRPKAAPPSTGGAAVLNALVSLWLNHSVRLFGVAQTLAAIDRCAAHAQRIAALNAPAGRPQ